MGMLEEIKHYSPSAVIKMGTSFIWTRLFFPKAQLIRKPFFLRGDKKNLVMGAGFTSGRACRIELFDNGVIKFGENCHIGDYVHLVASSSVEIGADCLFASKIFISDTSHGDYGKEGQSPLVAPNDRKLVSSFVKIGDKVWLGDNVVVLPGVTIGDGCVIGANATVTKDIPEYSIAAGSPAKVIKRYNFETNSWEKA